MNQPDKVSEDLVTRLTKAGAGDGASDFSPSVDFKLLYEARDEIERLREVLTIPTITPDTTSSALFLRVLQENEKGQPVNGQDLINALSWRVRNQRKEIARLNEALRRKASDEAPSFSPNFDERNGLR